MCYRNSGIITKSLDNEPSVFLVLLNTYESCIKGSPICGMDFIYFFWYLEIAVKYNIDKLVHIRLCLCTQES
jgi:hypothetical protein